MCFAVGPGNSKCGKSTTAKGGRSEKAARAVKSTRAGAVLVTHVPSFPNSPSSSKKHAKIKSTLDDETQRRKHFYGIDAGVKKDSKVGKKQGTKDAKKDVAK